MVQHIGSLGLVQVTIVVAGLLAVGCTTTTAGRQQTAALPHEQQPLARTTCLNDDVVFGSCVEFLHRQPLEFWQQYQQEAPALREGFLACSDLRDQFGDWVRGKRDELRQKDRQINMVSGYLPHSIVAESDMTINQMASAFIDREYHQIINSGARPELCRERTLFWKVQILSVTEKFPTLHEAGQPAQKGWDRRP